MLKLPIIEYYDFYVNNFIHLYPYDPGRFIRGSIMNCPVAIEKVILTIRQNEIIVSKLVQLLVHIKGSSIHVFTLFIQKKNYLLCIFPGESFNSRMGRKME